jgi:hypothetical protein
MKNITLNNQTQQRLKQVARQTGIPEADIVDRALDMFLIAEALGGLRDLAEDMSYWQQRYLDTVALDEERIANLDYDEGRNLGQ